MKKAVFLIAFLLLVVSVSAFDVSVFPEERIIKTNETAFFELEISHDSLTDELFEVFSTDVTWDVRTSEILRVKPGETVKKELIIRPLNLNPGAYNLPVNFKRSGTSEVIRKMLYIELQSAKPASGDYLPAVRGVARMDEQIDPREGVVLKLSVENQNRRQLDDLQVKVRSNVINKDYSTSLGPLEKKTLTFMAEIDPKTPPQKDSLEMTIIAPGDDKAYQFDVAPIDYEVIPYGSITPSVNVDESFLKRVETIVFVNDANREVTHVERVPASFFKRWLISGNPEPEVEEGELVWHVTLKPGESEELVVIYNYRPVFWVLFVLAVLSLAYYWFRSPIVVLKRARAIRTDEHGITEIKVVVELINRTGKVLRNVKLLDLLPNLVDVVEDERFVKPEVSAQKSKGTLLKWTVNIMEPKEHRIFVYRARTRLSILGGFTLPVAAAQFVADKQKRETVSNKPEIKA